MRDDDIVGIMVDAVAPRYPCVDTEDTEEGSPMDNIWQDQRAALDALRARGLDVREAGS